jgi:hypothetical protein
MREYMHGRGGREKEEGGGKSLSAGTDLLSITLYVNEMEVPDL